MWNIAICDDQPESIAYIKDRLADTDLPDIGKIIAFSNGKSMLEDLEDGIFDADIFILDIDLGCCSGIAIAEKILDIRPDCQIIFMSGYDDYYEAVYDVNHIYFMKKPVCSEILCKAVSKATQKLNSGHEEFFIAETKSGKHIISYKDISSFECDKRKINIIGRDGTLLCSFYGKFEDIESLLPASFHRCHNSIFLNLHMVKALENGCFILRDGRAVTISRSHRSESQLAFARFLAGGK